MIRLSDNGSLTTTNLVEMLGMTRPNTCTYLAKLKEEGFVVTEQSAADKRLRYHDLTGKGREYMDGWQSEQSCGRESFSGSGSGGYVESSPLESESEGDSVGDLLDECDEIVYDGENYRSR